MAVVRDQNTCLVRRFLHNHHAVFVVMYLMETWNGGDKLSDSAVVAAVTVMVVVGGD